MMHCARLRRGCTMRGLRLILDSCPTTRHSTIPGSGSTPSTTCAARTTTCPRAAELLPRGARPGGATAVLAYGRDPYFAGWPDTLQLELRQPGAARSDGRASSAAWRPVRRGPVRHGHAGAARCLRADVGHRPPTSGPRAIAEAGRPGFLFMAEVYWDLEWQLQQQGFDYTYDKRLYDRLQTLRRGDARPVRDHLRADVEFQRRSARFLENHDEPRAAATFEPTFIGRRLSSPSCARAFGSSLRGNWRGGGSTTPVHLCRAPTEADDPALASFYEGLLACLRTRALRDGEWRLLESVPAWGGNPTAPDFLTFAWQGPGRRAHRGLRQLRPAPEPVLRPPAVGPSGRPYDNSAGSARSGRLRAGWRRALGSGPVPRYAPVGVPRLRAGPGTG